MGDAYLFFIFIVSIQCSSYESACSGFQPDGHICGLGQCQTSHACMYHDEFECKMFAIKISNMPEKKFL